MKTIYYFVASSNLSESDKNTLKKVLEAIGEKTLMHLRTHGEQIKDLDNEIDKVYGFIHSKNGVLPKNLKEKIFRFMSDLHEAIDNLNAIHVHRTPISLKAYCMVFIYIFPLVYTPTIIYNIGENYNHSAAYFIVIITEFILISLYNIQDHLEYPFDDKGLDDIKLEHFEITR